MKDGKQSPLRLGLSFTGKGGLRTKRPLTLYEADPTPIVLYPGDDTTDEDAFALLSSDAMMFRVGYEHSRHAAY